MNNQLKILKVTILTLLFFCLGTSSLKTRVYAETLLDKARVSITFDDGYASVYDNALPILSANGQKATVFVTTSYMEQPGCLTWDQVRDLQNTYSWEIGSHTVNHFELPLLQKQEIFNEINDAKNTLTEQGLNVTSFATPFGAYNNEVLIQSIKTHNLHRGFWEREYLNTYPYERTVIATQSVDFGVSVAQVKAWIDQAVSENKWLVLVFHEVLPEMDPDYIYTTTISDFSEISEYIKSSSIEVVLPNFTLQKPGNNLFTSQSFVNGITEGWSTSSSTQVLLDTASNGNYPSPNESILFKGSNTSSYLFSNTIQHLIGSTYLFEAYINADSLTSGELGFYIDEYNTLGEWISGKWIGAVYPNQVANFSARYIPTSEAVEKFVIQTYLDAGSAGNVFVDNYEIYNLKDGSGTPIPDPVPDPTLDPTPDPIPEPVPSVNLVQNSSFESLIEGWATNWSRDNQGFTIDTTSKGNSGLNSLHFNTNTKAHVFSEVIPVTYGNQYTWEQYINITFTNGEFGFYIDEYDTNGNWISGQWKGQLSSTSSELKSISYTPTSENVKTIGLQYYIVSGSTINIYIDSVSFSQI